MAWVIVAGVLGVIIICGGLFLRRLLRQLAELRRQITWFDRQMRAQRARVTFLRQLIADEEDDGDGEPPPQAAVVNGNSPSDPPDPPDTATPVRRKGHLGLYLGGAIAAAAAAATAARQIISRHGSRLTAATVAATVTAATVTLITVRPWSGDSEQQPSSPGPTAAVSSATPPRRTLQPPASSNPPDGSGTSLRPPATASPTPRASLSPSATAVSSPQDIGISATLSPRPRRRKRHHSSRPVPPGQTRRPTPPERTRRPRPTSSPPAGTTPAAALCQQLVIPRLLKTDVCLVGR